MDYLEGLCLGRLWSDTDFENRRHLSLFLLYGVFVDLLVVYNYLTGGMNGLITGAFLQKVIIFVVLYVFRRVGVNSVEEKIGETLFAKFLDANNPISMFFE